MIDALFRRGNPTNKWSSVPGLKLTIELLTPSINGIPVGSAINELSFLGRSSSQGSWPLDFASLGLSLDFEEDGSFSGFQIVLEDPSEEMDRFSGMITLNHSVIGLSNILDELGDPYWIDRDDDEAIWFFEFPTHEIQIEQSLAGKNQRVLVTKQPVMADAEHRKRYGVDKAWPP